jgi:serine/threonine-protein kinase SRPK3
MFDPHPGTRYNKDDDHIAQVIELMGPFPRSIALSGKFSSDIFTRKGACCTGSFAAEVDPPHR